MNKSRKTSHILNVFQYDETTGAVTLPSTLSLTAPSAGDNSSKVATTAWARTFVASLSYLTSGTTTTSDIGEGTNLYYTQSRFNTAFGLKTTTNLTEGTNLYYTDSRVGTYLTSNGYATQSYVGTQLANLVAAAPATLDTLNELAAALGNDPSFATTVTTSIGTKVPQARTLTINGTTYDLSANRSWTITSMIYPGAGIAVSTGTAWGASITDNSTNWNTAYGWGNHASAGYLTSATAATTYASLTGAYANPAFVASLAYSKITGVPAFLTSYTETDPYRVTAVAVSGTSTKTITITRADASTVTTTWTDIDTDTNTYVTSAAFSGGTLTLTRNDAGTVSVSLDGRYYLASNPSGYITGITSSMVTTALGYTPYNSTNPSGYITSSALSSYLPLSGGILTGPLTGTTSNFNYVSFNNTAVAAPTIAGFSSLTFILNSSYLNMNIKRADGQTSSLYFPNDGYTHQYNLPATDGTLALSSAIPTNNNQLTNGAGYITGITSSNVTTALGYTPYNATNPAGYITGVTNISGNAGTVTNATFYRQFTVRDDRSDGSDYSLAARATGLYAINSTGTNGPGYGYLSLIHVSNGTDVAFQIAGGYNSDAMYFRGTYALQSGTGYSAWRTVIHSGNIGSQSVSYATTAGSVTGFSGTHSGSSSGTNTGDQTNISGYAVYLPTSYIGGVQANPQTYFNNGVGVKVAMTGSWSTWSDTLWINGYSGGDVKQMCALHTLRNGTPRMAISVQAHDATAYGTYYEFITAYNIASQTVASAGNATTAGGLAVHTDRNNEANKIVRTDSNGYIQAGWINTLSGDNGTSAITRIYASDDGYIRFYTPANFRQVLDVPTRTGGSASGTWGISISGNAATATTASSLAANTSPTIQVLNFTGVGTNSGNVNQSYAIYQEGGAWSPPFPDLCIGYHTGIKLGAYFGYNGIRFFNNSDFATQTFSVNDGDNHVRVAYNLYVGGTISGSNLSGTNTGDQTNISGNAATTSQRSFDYLYASSYLESGGAVYGTIFYDNNDRSYYLDPNSTSNVNAITMGGTLYMNGGAYYGTIIFGSSSYWRCGISQRDAGNAEMRIWAKGGGAGSIYFATGFDGEASATTLPSDGMALKNNNLGLGSWGVSEFPSYKLHVKGTGYATNDFRAPIFYDSNDTGYYLDPNGTSNLYKFSEFTMAYNGMNPMSANSPYSSRYSGSANYRNGTMGYGNTDFNVMFSNWGSGFIDSWSSPANAPGGSSHYVGLQGFHYNYQNSSQAYGFQMACAGEADNRFFWRSAWPNLRGWVEMIHSGNIGSQKVNGAQKLWAESHPNDYYIVNNWTGSHWRLTTNHGSPVRVGYSDDTGAINSAVGSSYYWSGIQYFETNNGGSAVNNSNSAKLEAYSSSNNTAFMSFHRGGYYAVNFGLDNDNVMRIGGWSAGANRWQLDMSGNMTVAGDVTAYSDARVKENIITVDNALTKVLSLRGVYYNRIDSDDKKTKIGVIAQETLLVVPEVVNQDNDGMFNVSYGNLAGLFIEAIKEQQKEIEELKTIIYGLTR